MQQEQYFEKLAVLAKKELDLYVRYAVRLREDGGIRHIFQTKIFREELENLLEDSFQCMDKKAYEMERSLLSEEWAMFHEEAYQSVKSGIILPFEYLLRRMRLTEFETYCACLALAPELNREFERMYCFLQDDYTMKYPTLDLCLKMFSMDSFVQKKLIRQIFRRKTLLQCIFQAKPQGMESALSWKLKLRKNLIEYTFFYESDLLGQKAEYELWVPTGNELCALNVNRHIADILAQALSEEETVAQATKKAFLLQGAAGSGKRLQIRQAAASQGRTALFFDLRRIGQKTVEQKKDMILDVVVRAVLTRACLCFCHLEALKVRDSWDLSLTDEIFQTAGLFFENIFFTAQTGEWQEENGAGDFQVERFTMRMPALAQRIHLWKEALAGLGIQEEVAIESLSVQFDFTPGMIKEAAACAGKKAAARGPADTALAGIYEACQEKISHRLGERASRVRGVCSWEDLILETEAKELLLQACAQITYRYRVYEEWGFQKKLAYGRGVTMLFAGPPGTGKTMAAQVLAKELNLELYKVDLSGVLSKYIGETQKNLKEIFDEAQKSRSILFFDEADALFGKRVNVTDARDISANAQTAYLLQKMEEYDGVTILATNLLQNFDDAYKRRIKYIIPFVFPQKEHRRALWEKAFPAETPAGEDIDREYLAANFELSGASIKNIALNAAFMAASMQENVEMKHVMASLQQEYKKSGKTLGKEELGEYYIYKKEYLSDGSQHKNL